MHSLDWGGDGGISGRMGECGGRGDVGSPIILEWRFPRSDCVTETFKPLVAATLDAFDIFDATGVSGGVIRIAWSFCCDPGPGLESDEDSTVKSPSVVSVPLSS
jgi:hypothetical protein